jgi:hypothetical protein
MDAPVPGVPAPDFALVAAGSGREVSLSSCAGRSLVLVFHGQSATFTVERLNRLVRERYPSAGEVVVASVADLSLVPPPFYLTARMALDYSYREGSQRVPEGSDPADYVVILGDWTGRVTRLYGASAAYLSPVVFVIGPDGVLKGRYSGPDLASGVLELLEKGP